MERQYKRENVCLNVKYLMRLQCKLQFAQNEIKYVLKKEIKS